MLFTYKKEEINIKENTDSWNTIKHNFEINTEWVNI